MVVALPCAFDCLQCKLHAKNTVQKGDRGFHMRTGSFMSVQPERVSQIKMVLQRSVTNPHKGPSRGTTQHKHLPAPGRASLGSMMARAR